MINYTPQNQLSLSLFKHPFQQELDKENRWVQLAQLVPWDELAIDINPGRVEPNGTGGYDVYDNMFDINPGRIEPNGTGGYDVYDDMFDINPGTIDPN